MMPIVFQYYQWVRCQTSLKLSDLIAKFDIFRVRFHIPLRQDYDFQCAPLLGLLGSNQSSKLVRQI